MRSLCVCLCVACLPWLLLACGGDSTAILKLMDAPPAGVTSVKLHVAGMDVHVVPADKAKDADPNDTTIDHDAKWETLKVDREIDLLLHQGEGAAATLGELPLPDGKVTQIRLHLDMSKPQTVVQNGNPCDLDLSQVPTTGIKISHPFKAFATKDGSEHEVLVDLDLGQSLHPAAGCFRLVPVLKLMKVKTDGHDEQI